MLQPPDSYNGAKRGRCRARRLPPCRHRKYGAIVIPALAATIGLAAALVIGVIAGSCAAASGPNVTAEALRRTVRENGG